VFSESAHLYDVIYRTFKDYAAEATAIATVVRAAHPSARTILDVGCGTGEHALHLRKHHGFAVDGLDRDPGLLAVAREKLPDARFFEADMATFDVGHRYDVVMCLFSSIGYLKTLERVTAALRCFRRHLAADGVIVVEPWFAPGVLREGPGSTRRAEAGGVRVERASHTTVEERLSTLIFDYRFEDASGVRVAREVHELGLFTQEEMMASFREAGLATTYDSSGLTGRGLYVARIAP
jgi:ubiquinone/menaquinone biosynthesis C-methylase UbiE